MADKIRSWIADGHHYNVAGEALAIVDRRHTWTRHGGELEPGEKGRKAERERERGKEFGESEKFSTAQARAYGLVATSCAPNYKCLRFPAAFAS